MSARHWFHFVSFCFEFNSIFSQQNAVVGLTWFVALVASMPLCRAALLLVMWSGRDFDLNHCRAVNWTSDCCFVAPMMDTIFVPIPIRVLAMVTPSWSSPARVRRNAALSRYQPLDHKRKCWRINWTHSMTRKKFPKLKLKTKSHTRAHKSHAILW